MAIPDAVFDAIQSSEEHMDLATGRAAVLERLFELMAVIQVSTPKVDFATEREEQFWRGLRQLAVEISEDLIAISAAQDVIEQHQREASRADVDADEGGAR